MKFVSVTDIKNNLLTLVKSPVRLISLIIPPVAVLAIMFVVFAMNSMYPFGAKSLAWCDMHQQVVPLLLDFKDILTGKGDFFLNMQNASGMNFYGVFLFFISSPLSFLVAFVDKADMMVFMNILTVLKMMLCAVTANAYFRHCHKNLHPYYGALFSVMYAFCGYAMLFYQNTIWLDVMYFFPLLMISFEALTKKRKTRGMIFCLAGMLVLNYYLSYMVVLFTVLFFGLYIFMHRKNSDKKIAHLFVVSCLIAALISAVIWLPAFAQYLSSARGANIIDGLLKCSLFTDIYTNLPLLFCTMFGFAAVVVFFGRRKTKASRMYAILAILMLLPIVFEPINKMWHTGDYMAFPVRYGYISVFMILIFAAVKLKNLSSDAYAKSAKLRYTIPAAIVIIAYGMFTLWYYAELKKDLDSYSTTLWGNSDSFVLLLIAASGFGMIFTYLLGAGVMKKMRFSVMAVLLAVLTVFECIFSAQVYVAAASFTPTKFDNAIVLEDKIPDDDFYRVTLQQNQYKYFDANLIGGLGYNTIAHYTSLTSEDYMFAMKKLGYSSYWMEVTGNGGTLLTDAIMSVKYRIERFTARDGAIYRDKNYSIFENEYFLPLGIISDSDLSQLADLPDVSEFERGEIQEYIAKLLLGAEEKLFTRYEPDELLNLSYSHEDSIYYFVPDNPKRRSAIEYTINVGEKQTLYLDCFDLVTRNVNEHVNNSFSVYVDGIKVNIHYPDKDTNGLLNLGTFENDIVKVSVDVNKSVYCDSFGIYGLSHDKLDNLLDNTKTAGLTVNGSEISGSVNDAKDGQYLFLSVPFDKGFECTINGEKAEIYRAFGGFMAVRLDEGNNDIKFTFVPQGFRPGMLLTIAGLLLAVVWAVFRKKLAALLSKAEKICTIGVYALFFGVVAVIYVIPVILCVAGAFIK